MQQDPPVRAHTDARVGVITLNRPRQLNALDDAVMNALGEALLGFDADAGIGAIVITGGDTAFAAGADIAAMVDWTYTDVVRDDFITRNWEAIRRVRKPVIAAVAGFAFGGGCELALACDIVLAAKSASFVEVFCKLGLIPDTGGTWHLPRLVGHARAMGMAMLGEKIPAELAEQWGLIWKAVPDTALMDEATAMAEHFAVAPTKGLAFTKRAMQASYANSLPEQLKLEGEMMRELGYSHDYREGVTAFIEKRAPHFMGE